MAETSVATKRAIAGKARPGGKPDGFDAYTIAVLVPCFNEEATIQKVVRDFHAALRA